MIRERVRGEKERGMTGVWEGEMVGRERIFRRVGRGD